MKKMACFVVALCVLLTTTAMADGVSVTANPQSNTGYTVSFEYKDDQADQVRVAGDFHFFTANDPLFRGIGYIRTPDHAARETLVFPEDWKKDSDLYHFGTPDYVGEMTKSEETGKWVFSIDLPCGPYLYSYQVSYDNGETFTAIPDPVNIPLSNTLGAKKVTSKFYVPYDSEKQSSEVDYSWAEPVSDEAAKGQVVHVTYTGLDVKDHETFVYLPVGYDAERAEPYKVLYLIPGGNGTFADWVHDYDAADIVDRYVMNGEVEPFVFVCTANNEFGRINTNDPYNLSELALNVEHCMMPYMEANFNVSSDPAGRAIAGLSYGARVSSLMWINNPELFKYYGVFSASAAWMWQDTNSKMDLLRESVLYLGGAFADHLTLGSTYQTAMENTVYGFRDLLDANGFTYNGGNGIFFMQGGHDRYTFQSEFNDFVKTTLWK